MKFTLYSALAALTTSTLAAPLFSRQANATSSVNGTTTANSTSSGADGPVGYASLNGGTTGGAGGPETTVTSIDELMAAVEGDEPAIIYIDSVLSGSSEKIRVGSNKSILGRSSAAGIEGAGLFIKEARNVIVRNLAISKVSTGEKDAIGVQKSENVWIDHCDLSSDLDHGKDYYDGLADFTHGSDYITVSNTKFHDHYKASLCGHTDSNAAEDAGKLHVTYANNHWANINSRMPLVRFGTAHVFNGYYEGGDSAVNTRMGAQVLVESNAMAGVEDAVVSEYSDEDGYAVVRGNELGGGSSTAPEGTLVRVPYEYELLGSENVKAAVVGVAGNTLAL